MRALILIAAAALALGACRDNDQADNAVNADASLSAGSIASNDVTAIDAVTGADANMAADVNYFNDVDSDSNAAVGSSGNSAQAKSRAGNAAAPTTRDSAPEPAGNTTANAATNNAL